MGQMKISRPLKVTQKQQKKQTEGDFLSMATIKFLGSLSQRTGAARRTWQLVDTVRYFLQIVLK